MKDELVTLKVKDKIALVTLNRPNKKNALNRELLVLLYNAIEKIKSDDQIRVGIITGSGSAFSSGIDLKVIRDDKFLGIFDKKTEISELMRVCQKPLIGAINGIAITGGLEIALNCDFLIASNKASFIDTHVRVGIHPGWGITYLLQQAIGQRRAKQMSFTCQPISAKTAYEWGLVNEIIPSNLLISRALEIANKICENETGLLPIIKDLIENRNRMSQEASHDLERKGFKHFVKLNFKTSK